MNRTAVSPYSIVAAAVLTAALFLAFGVDVMRVRGNSMVPALREGQIIVVNTAAFGLTVPLVRSYLIRWHDPSPGDVVVFPHPARPRLQVKRVVAGAGDPVEVTENSLTIGEESFPLPPDRHRLFSRYESIPPGSLFVAGDNRALSEDSREYGFVPIEKIIGKVIFFSPKASRKGPAS